MLEQFVLKKNHLRCAHELWKEHLRGEGNAIDATCGRGGDLLILADYLLLSDCSSNEIFVYDIQKRALEIAQLRAQSKLSSKQLDHISWIENCHSNLGKLEGESPISLIIYNLGYLPGGDKELTTCVKTTRLSLIRASQILQPRGAISAMCYPGHREGAKEAEEVMRFAEHLSALDWKVAIYRQPNAPLAPFLIWLIKHSQ